MAREHARVKLSIWEDDDFRALPCDAQHLYFVLLTSPKLDYAGVTDWRATRIAPLVGDWTVDRVEQAAETLSTHHYIVIDEESEEVLLRSFIRHDELLESPNMAVAMRKAHASIASGALRAIVVHELGRLHKDKPDLKGWPNVLELLDKPSISAFDYPSFKASVNPSRNPSARVTPIPSANPSGDPSPTTATTPSTATTVVIREEDSSVPLALVLENAPDKPAPKGRPRDELWEAVTTACNVDVERLTTTGRGALNKALAELREVGADPAEVRARARSYASRFPKAPLTAPALAKHWATLSPSSTPRATPWNGGA